MSHSPQHMSFAGQFLDWMWQIHHFGGISPAESWQATLSIGCPPAGRSWGPHAMDAPWPGRVRAPRIQRGKHAVVNALSAPDQGAVRVSGGIQAGPWDGWEGTKLGCEMARRWVSQANKCKKTIDLGVICGTLPNPTWEPPMSPSERRKVLSIFFISRFFHNWFNTGY